MRFPFSNVCNTSERLLSEGRVTCAGPYNINIRVRKRIGSDVERNERGGVQMHTW
jgi:hypothetical protein